MSEILSCYLSDLFKKELASNKYIAKDITDHAKINTPDTVFIDATEIALDSAMSADFRLGYSLSQVKIEPNNIQLSFYRKNPADNIISNNDRLTSEYVIQGAGLHFGSANSGHWIALIKKENGPTAQWFRHDDSSVY